MTAKPFHEIVKQVCFQIHGVRKDIFSCARDIEGLRQDLSDLAKLMDELCLLPEFNMNQFGTTDVSIIKVEDEGDQTQQ